MVAHKAHVYVFAGPMADIPRDKPLECLFMRIDEDNSGSIEFSEFHAWATAWHYVKLMTCDYQEELKALGITGQSRQSPIRASITVPYALFRRFRTVRACEGHRSGLYAGNYTGVR